MKVRIRKPLTAEQRERKRARARERAKLPEVKARYRALALQPHRVEAKKRYFEELALQNNTFCFFMIRKCACCGETKPLRMSEDRAPKRCSKCRIIGKKLNLKLKTVNCKRCGAEVDAAKNWKQCNKCNLELRRAHEAKRKALQRGATIGEAVFRHKVFALDGWRCRMCKRKVQDVNHYAKNAAELDHIIPLTKGGLHTYDNTQTLCRACNNKKSNNIIPTQMRLALM